MYHLDETLADSCEALAHDCRDLSLRALKDKVIDTVNEQLDGVRMKYEELMRADAHLLGDISDEGSRKASANANATMSLVREALGL